MRSWLVYGSVVLVSVATGVMLGGGPSALLDSSDSSPLVSSADDVPPAAPEIPEFVAPSVDLPPADSEPTPTDVAQTTSSTTTSTTSTTTSSTTTTTEPPAPSSTRFDQTVETADSPEPADVELVSREDVSVAVYNGIGTLGLAGRAANALTRLGYVDPATRDTAPTGRTLVYFRFGLEAEASRLAVDSGLPPDATESIEQVARIFGSSANEFNLVLVLGGDRVGLAAA